MFLSLEELAEQGELAVHYSPPPKHKPGWFSLSSWLSSSSAPASRAREQQQQQQQQQQKWGRWGKEVNEAGSPGGVQGRPDGDADGRAGSNYTCFFMTDVDQRTYLAQGPQVSAVVWGATVQLLMLTVSQIKGPLVPLAPGQSA